MRIRSLRVLLGLSAIVSLSACGLSGVSGETSTAATSTSTSTSTSSVAPVPSMAAPPMTVGPETRKWVDLEVGDCITDVPAVDLGEVTVSIVDCAAPHAAEVYLRAPVEVNAAITDVANRACVAGVAEYTGRSVDGSPYSMTYLIDSRQDRTSNNPLPSTVICLLQSASGRALTESARR